MVATCVRWQATGVPAPTPLDWCPGAASRAAPGPPGPGCSLLATPHRAEPSLPIKCLSLLLAIPRGQRIWQAVGCIIAVPVNVLVEAGQPSTPWAVSWKLEPQAHQQCPIIDCPCEVLKMVGVVHIQQGQGIWHALLLRPMLLLSASQCREAQNFVGYYELFVHASLLLHLVKHVK